MFNMNKQIEKIKNFRLFLLKQLDDLTIQQLNEIPAGYSNNIIWNLAHLICAEQSMCYVRAGQPITVADAYFSPYAPGTKPVEFVDEPEIMLIKQLLITTIEELQADYAKGLFATYSPSAMTPRVYGVEVNDIEGALDFLLYHEGFHAGYILSLKHLVRQTT